MRRRHVAVFGGAVCSFAFIAGSAAAQETAEHYPSRNITLVVSFAAGGPSDFVGRTFGQAISDILGKPVIIENRPGGGSSIGTGAVVKAAPDGYTLGLIDVSLTIMPITVAKLSYDPLRDIVPISQTAQAPLTLVVANNVPAKTTKELVELARKKPDEIKFAHSGVGSPPHLASLSFLQATGIRTLLISYRGANPAVQDIVAGHVSMLMTAPSTTVSLTQAGKIRMIGVTGDRRLKALPEVPTLKEQGIDLVGLDSGVWFGIGAPKGVPADIVAKLNATINKAAKDAALIEKLGKFDMVAKGSTQAQMAELIKTQAATWAATLSKAGFKPKE